MAEMPPLERSIAAMATAHAGELDKFGEPYVLHVMRVIGLSPPGDAKIVAALHDAVEHTDIQIGPGDYDPQVREALEAVRRRGGREGEEKESYKAYIKRVAANPLAAVVKLADTRDRMAHVIYAPDDMQAKYAPRYRDALKVLEKAVRGDVPDLAAGAATLEPYTHRGVAFDDQ